MLDYEYLIHLLYCFVNGTAPQEKPDGVSFESVFRLAEMHEVANIAFLSVEKLETKPPEELYNEWQLSYYMAVQRDTVQKLEYEKTVSALHESRIRTLEAQGTVTKTLYPSPDLRMMSDIDLIIDFENLQRAMEIMRSIGYETNQKQPHEFDAHGKDGSLIEFHTEFFPEYMFNRKERYYAAINSPFSHIKQGDGLSCYLDDTYYYLFSIIHTIVHFETAGCGIRRILDLYYLKKAFEGKTDKAFIEKVIDENGMRESYDKLFAVRALWFENTPSALDLSETVHDIVNAGNHGAADIFTRNNIRKDSDEGIRHPKLRRIALWLFPPKEYVYLGYPVCRERGYSTVRCWFYRFFATVKKFRFSHALSFVKTVIKSK